MSRQVYRFGEYRLDPSARELSSAGVPATLSPKVFDVLAYLVEHRDRAVGRDELIAAVWGRTDVSDTLLGQTVLKARRAIGDTGNEQHAIRTVPRFGYRWVGELVVETVRPIDDPNPPAPVPSDTDAAPTPAPATVRRPKGRWWQALLAACTVAALLALATRPWWLAESVDRTPVAAAPDAAIAVLPVAVAQGEEWAWLRLGLMDLIATRLRQGGQAVIASDNVVALLRRQPVDDAAGMHALRELTGARHLAAAAVERVGGEWQVRIQLRGADDQRREVLARAADPIGAARDAGDRLLVLLGHAPPADGERVGPLSQSELQQRIEAALLGDDFAGARRLVEGAPEALRDSAPIRLQLAQIEFRSGRYASARTGLEHLLASTSAADDAMLRAGALFLLGAVEIRDDRSSQALHAFDEAIALAESGREPRVLGQAYTGRAAARVNLGRFDDAAADLARARIALELAGDALALARVDANEGVLDNARGRHAEALRILQRAAGSFERFGAINDLSLTVAAEVRAHLALLDADGALAASEELWGRRAQIANPRSRASFELQRARALAAKGRITEARGLLDELDQRVDAADTSGLPGDIASERARLALDARDYAAAASAARRAVDRLPTLDEAPERARAWLSLGRALLGAGDADAARMQADAFARWAAPQADQPTVTLLAALAQAELARVEDRREEAYRSYAAALVDAERRTVPRDLVAVAQSYGGSLLDDGEHEQASAVIGRVARWGEQDFDCAILQARLYHALGQVDAWQSALAHARALAGERAIPAALLDAPAPMRRAQRSTGMP